MIPVVGTRISDACAAELAGAFVDVAPNERLRTISALRADARSFRTRPATPEISLSTFEAIAASYDAVADRIETLQIGAREPADDARHEAVSADLGRRDARLEAAE